MKTEEMTSKQISDELSNRGVQMHFNSSRDKLEAALAASSAPNTESVIANEAIIAEITEEELIANDFMWNGVELEGMREANAMKLVRIILRSNDPLKRDSQGEIFTVGNRGFNGGKAVKKYIPYNNEDGWHVPNMLLDHLKAAETQIFKKVTRNGQDFMEPTNIKAFNIEILPPLTEDERQTLQIKQKATGSIG